MRGTRTADRLTRTETGELDTARAHLVGLVAAARAVVATSGHDPDRVGCREAGCRLADLDDGPAWCRVAHRLDLLDVDTPPFGGERSLEETVEDFRRALVDALDAVRACRSIGHAEGRCWFTDPHGRDVCGEVLRLAHRAG